MEGLGGGPLSGRGDTQLAWQLLCALRQRATPATLCGLMRELSGGKMAADSQAALLGCLRTPAAALLPADADYTRWVGGLVAGRAVGQSASPPNIAAVF